MGWMYAGGRGVNKDPKIAVERYRKAATRVTQAVKRPLGTPTSVASESRRIIS